MTLNDDLTVGNESRFHAAWKPDGRGATLTVDADGVVEGFEFDDEDDGDGALRHAILNEAVAILERAHGVRESLFGSGKPPLWCPSFTWTPPLPVDASPSSERHNERGAEALYLDAPTHHKHTLERQAHAHPNRTRP
jgi:hypothetical protein